MDEKSIKLKVISKDGIRFNGDVASLTLPSITGEITILPHHISLLSGLKTGKIRLVPTTGAKVILDIISGFVRIVNNECVVTIEEAQK